MYSQSETYELGECNGGHPDLELAHAEDVEGEQSLCAPYSNVSLSFAVASSTLARAHHLSGGV